jgi:hypothetical protein
MPSTISAPDGPGTSDLKDLNNTTEKGEDSPHVTLSVSLLDRFAQRRICGGRWWVDQRHWCAGDWKDGWDMEQRTACAVLLLHCKTWVTIAAFRKTAPVSVLYLF